MSNASELIDDRYRVLEPLTPGILNSEDGFTGRDFLCLATDMQSGALCALRRLPPADAATLEDVRREVEQLQALDHPNIVPPGEVKGSPQAPYLVRDFVDGKSLDDVLKASLAPLSLARACSIAKQIALALEAAHHAAIIHGNLKPSDILLTDIDGVETVRVLGFGLLPLRKHGFISLARLALEDGGGLLKGTPEYISPEQAMGTTAEALDGRSDLYSLGVILYQMLAGEALFTGPPMEVLLAHIFTEPKPLSAQSGPEAPLALETLLMRMLAKKRADRPASATAVIDQLAPWEEKREVPAEPAQEGDDTNNHPATPIPTSLEEEIIPPASAAPEAQPAPVFSFSSPASPGPESIPRWETPVAQTSAFVPPPIELGASPVDTHGSMDDSINETDADSPAAEPVAHLEPPQEPAISSPLIPEPPPFPDLAEAAYEPESARAQYSFLPDLAHPAGIAEAKDKAPESPAGIESVELTRPSDGFDVHLNQPDTPPLSAPPIAGPAVSTTVVHPVAQYRLANPSARPRRGHPWLKGLTAAALIIIILAAGACGWLYVTGRTYWFNPQFLKAKASYYLASGSGAPQTEVVAQPSNQAPPSPVSAPNTPAPAISQKTASSTPATTRAVQQTPTGGQPASETASSIARPAANLSHKQASKPASAAGGTITPAPAAPSAAESAAVEDAITRGEYYFDRGDYDAAIQVYEETLSQFPSNPQLTAEIARARRAKAAESKYLR